MTRTYTAESQAAHERIRTFAALQGRSAFDLITGAMADRDDETQDNVLRQVLRGASDLLQTEVWGQERELPDWTDNVCQPARPTFVRHADWTLGARCQTTGRKPAVVREVKRETLREVVKRDTVAAERTARATELRALQPMSWLASE